MRDLEFNLTVPTVFCFLYQFASLAQYDVRPICMANYLINLTLVDINMNKWQPSLLARACLQISEQKR